jgi:hypothetical protein
MKPSPLIPMLILATVSAVGCAPAIGDECETALDCSSQGSRQCDRTQPGGYCTIGGCERGTCPEESVCVKFRPSLERIAVTYCMATCEQNDDCRDDEGYTCTSQAAFPDGLAEVLDDEDGEFCSIPLAIMSPPPADDASIAEPTPDASTNGDDAGR